MNIAQKSGPIPNQANLERAIAVIGGSLLAYYGTKKRSVLGAGMAILGAGLVQRGIFGPGLFGPTKNPRINRAVSIGKSKEEIYAFWRKLENLPKFMCRLKSVKVTGPTTSHWTAKGPGDSTVEWDAELINDVENELIAWKTLPGAKVDHTGSVRFENAAGGRGSVVRISIAYNPPGGTAASAMAKFFGVDPALQVTEDLRKLKALLESRQVANTEGQVTGKPAEVAAQSSAKRESEAKIQEASENSFPASDAPAYR